MLLRRKYSPTIWTNLKFQQYTALADPNWTFIHFSHSIELIDKHRDTYSGLFNLADLTSVIRYRVPESDFPSRGDDRARSFGALVPVSE